MRRFSRRRQTGRPIACVIESIERRILLTDIASTGAAVEEPAVEELAVEEPAVEEPAVVDPTPTSPTPGEEPFEIEWEGDFTQAERDRIVRLMNEIRDRVDVILNELNTLESSLTESEREYLQPEFDAFRTMLTELAAGLDSDTNLEIGREFAEDSDAFATMWNGGYYLLAYYDAELTFNDALDWNEMSDDQLGELIFHELTHLYGTEDDDSAGELMNAHMIDGMINGSFDGHPLVTHLVNEAEDYMPPPDHPFDLTGDGVYDLADHMLWGP